MKDIAIITENFLIPWYPDDIDDFLGGSQEVIVLFSEMLKRNGYDVSVFTFCESKETIIKPCLRNEISYTNFDEFKKCYSEFKTIILFKVNPLLELKNKFTSHQKIIFWSSDVQKVVPRYFDLIRTRVCLTNYHKQMNQWDDAIVIPHGIDKKSLDENKADKIPNTVLFSSSLDRGLEELVNAWSNIKKHFPNLKLKVTYGFKISNQISSNIGKQFIKVYEKNVIDVCSFLGIEYLANISKKEMEKLYWESEYWILPLNKAESELFCLNAIKAQYCGCIPIVNKIGALQETVGDYIPFENLLKGDKTIKKANNTIPSYSWDDVLQIWKPIL